MTNPLFRFAEWCALATLIGFFCSTSEAETMRPSSIIQNYQSSAAVIAVQILSLEDQTANEKVCGTKYIADVISSFKGKYEDGSKIQFGDYRSGDIYPRLNIGEEYLLFLHELPTPEVMYEASNRGRNISSNKSDKKADLDEISCGGIAPGLNYDPRVLWPVKYQGVEITGLLPNSLPSTIHIDHQEGGRWFLRQEDVFNYLRELDKKLQ